MALSRNPYYTIRRKWSNILNHTVIQTVENSTALLPTLGSHKAAIDGYSTILAACR